jgi:hypothetical protein
MLILFETPAGFALFKANDKKLAKVDNVFEEFATAEKAQNLCVGLRCGGAGSVVDIAEPGSRELPPPAGGGAAGRGTGKAHR